MTRVQSSLDAMKYPGQKQKGRVAQVDCSPLATRSLMAPASASRGKSTSKTGGIFNGSLARIFVNQATATTRASRAAFTLVLIVPSEKNVAPGHRIAFVLNL